MTLLWAVLWLLCSPLLSIGWEKTASRDEWVPHELPRDQYAALGVWEDSHLETGSAEDSGGAGFQAVVGEGTEFPVDRSL